MPQRAAARPVAGPSEWGESIKNNLGSRPAATGGLRAIEPCCRHVRRRDWAAEWRKNSPS